MYVRISKLLDAEQLALVNAAMDEADYVEGRSTGGPAIQDIKNNLQLAREQPSQATESDNLILSALWNHPTLRSAILPTQILAPYYTRYLEGMAYGAHVDNPVMGANPTVRTDASMTLFLNDPEAYDGGELVVKSEVGDARFKLPAGDAILYPASTLHAVNPVTRGERRVAVTWIQSMIADSQRRRMVYEVDRVCQSLFQKMPDSEEYRILMKTYGNLVRLWGHP